MLWATLALRVSCLTTVVIASGCSPRPAGKLAPPAADTAHGSQAGKPVRIKILGFNDFHGQLAPKQVSGRPAGGAAVLAAYLHAAARGSEERTFIVHAGDHVGASPPSSALLQDEPAVSFLNDLTSPACSVRSRDGGACNVIGTLGNHEFDEGKSELLRLLDGGDHAKGPFLEDPWLGRRYAVISANVVDDETGRTLFPPYAVRHVDGVPLAFIGATLRETPTIVTPSGVAGLSFLDEADAINGCVPELQRKGIHAIVVQIHQGDSQPSYTGPTDPRASAATGALTRIIERLDDDIDVVVAGHTHQFTNALLPNRHGKPILVVQAFSGGTAYDDIELVVDATSHDVISKTASVVTTWADAGPGLAPDPEVEKLVAEAEARVAPLAGRVIGTAKTDVTRAPTAAGESALGDLIAESQRAALGADFGLMNPGGIRADLSAGTLTWGALFTVEPFGNVVVGMTLTGEQLIAVLNQQWSSAQPATGRLLQIAGFGYTWDSAVAPGGQRIVEVHTARGTPLEPKAKYRVAVNAFLAGGGDNFTVLTRGVDQVGGPSDLDALIATVRALPQPLSIATDGRINRR